jgi:hypothetical protein
MTVARIIHSGGDLVCTKTHHRLTRSEALALADIYNTEMTHPGCSEYVRRRAEAIGASIIEATAQHDEWAKCARVAA